MQAGLALHPVDRRIGIEHTPRKYPLQQAGDALSDALFGTVQGAEINHRRIQITTREAIVLDFGLDALRHEILGDLQQGGRVLQKL